MIFIKERTGDNMNIKEKIVDGMKYFYSEEEDKWFPQFEEENGLTYEFDLKTFTYLPLIELDEEYEPEYQLTMWGIRHLNYLKQHKKGTYQRLMIGGLREHLVTVDKAANEMEDLLMEQMSEAEGITEELKRRDMFEWVGRRINLKNRVREIIYHYYIYI